MKKAFLLSIITALAVGLAACTSNIKSDSYEVGSVGEVNTSVSGVVQSVREVQVSGNDDTGKLVGGVLGAVAGSAIGGGTRSHILGGVAGATAGGIAGGAAGRGMSKQTGLEYVIKTDDGRTLSVVQGNDTIFQVGQRVRLLYGKRARLVAE